MHWASIPAYNVQRVNFHKKWKWWIYNILAFLCIFDGFLNLWVFFCGKLTKPCRHARTFQLVSQQSVASINNKNHNILTKRPPVATNVPSGTQRHHWGLVYRGIPSDLRSRPEQSHHLPGALLSRWLQAVYRDSNRRPHLQLYRKGAYIHYLWLYSENTAKKDVTWWKLALWTSNLFSMRHLLNALSRYTGLWRPKG